MKKSNLLILLITLLLPSCGTNKVGCPMSLTMEEPIITVLSYKNGSKNEDTIRALYDMQEAADYYDLSFPHTQIGGAWVDNGMPGIVTLKDKANKEAYTKRYSAPKDGDIFRSRFNPFKNSMSIGWYEMSNDALSPNINNYIAELGHAYQLGVRGVKGFIAMVARDWILHPYISNKGYERLYHIKGTLEYEAHKVIEPKIVEAIVNGDYTPVKVSIGN